MAALADIGSDIMRAMIGLVISVVLAIFLPAIARGRLDELLADFPGYLSNVLGF